jgi:hypothetical protein
MQPGVTRIGRLALGGLEQREVVVLLAEAQEDRAAREVFVRELQAQRAHVEVLRLLGVADPQHDVTELPSLDHGWLLCGWFATWLRETTGKLYGTSVSRASAGRLPRYI